MENLRCPSYLSKACRFASALLALLLSTASAVSAQCGPTLASFVEYTTNTSGTAQCTNPNVTVPNPVLTRVNGATSAVCASGFSSAGFPNTTTFSDTGPAVRLTVTPNVGYQLNVTNITFQLRRSQAGAPALGPGSCRVAYSVDGGTTWINNGANLTPGNNATCSVASALSWNVPDFSTTNTLMVQIYGFASGGPTGQLQIRLWNIEGTVIPTAVSGCTNPAACNYNPAATFDNGTCTLPGCTAAGACNYNATAGCDNGSCYFQFGPCNDGDPGTVLDQWINCSTCQGVAVSANSPYIGYRVTEVPIPAAQQAIIEAGLPINGPNPVKCYQIRVCFEEQNWELRTLYGVQGTPWSLITSGSFYQNPIVGDYMAAGINSAFFGFFPEAAYDSWFTIGDGYGSGISIATLPGGATSTLEIWETNGLSFNENTVIGSAVFGIWTNPNPQGEPGVITTGVPVAQLTTDASFTLTLNLQFRQLNSDGTLYLPVTVAYEPGIVITNGTFEPDICFQPSILPVGLVSFEAKPDGDHESLLTWTTVSELNNDYFVIERSPDGDKWEDVVSIDGMGTTENVTHYTAYDRQARTGVNYYRLRQVDFDGQVQYTDIRAVEFTAPAADLSVYPNPNTGDWVNIKGDTDAINALHVYALDGKRVLSLARGSQAFRQVNLQELDLPSGLYSLEFVMGDGSSVFEKLTVQR